MNGYFNMCYVEGIYLKGISLDMLFGIYFVDAYSHNLKGDIRKRFQYWGISNPFAKIAPKQFRTSPRLLWQLEPPSTGIIYNKCIDRSQRQRVRDWRHFYIHICVRIDWWYNSRFSQNRTTLITAFFLVYRQRFFLAAVLFALFKSKSADCRFFR